MVFLRSNNELAAAYSNMVGVYNGAEVLYQPDNILALELAALRHSENVLEVGTASGRLLADAKLTVGTGTCVGVDAVQGLLQSDFPHTLQGKGLTVYPSGTTSQQVHRLHANVIAGDFVQRVQALAGTPPTYDCIFAIHVFQTVPPDARLVAMRNLRSLLSPTGRIVMDMSARFSKTEPPASMAHTPVQFRTNPGYTEAPGALVLSQAAGPRVMLPRGIAQPKTVISTNQLSLDRLWVVARQQASAAAERAGFSVTASLDIGRGDRYGIPVGNHSLSPAQLNSMPIDEIMRATNQRQQPFAYHCTGRTWEALLRRDPQFSWSQQTPTQHDFLLCEQTQQVALQEVQRIEIARAAGVKQNMEWTQLGVMVVLRHR